MRNTENKNENIGTMKLKKLHIHTYTSYSKFYLLYTVSWKHISLGLESLLPPFLFDSHLHYNSQYWIFFILTIFKIYLNMGPTPQPRFPRLVWSFPATRGQVWSGATGGHWRTGVGPEYIFNISKFN